MIIAILVGLILGFILAMPPGPVGVTAMKLGIDKGVKPATYMALGSGFLDVFFCLLAVFAATAVVAALSDFMNNHPIYSFILQAVVVVGFIIYGLINLKRAKNNEQDFAAPEIENKSKIIRNLKEKGPFFLGVGIALTNMANPTFLPSLGYIAMQIHKFNLFDASALNNLWFSIGFGLGNFLWLYLLATFVIKLQEKFSSNFILRVRQFAGITFISFGGILGWRLLFFTKWSELLRIVVAF